MFLRKKKPVKENGELLEKAEEQKRRTEDVLKEHKDTINAVEEIRRVERSAKDRGHKNG
jgi:hypothetical protein